MATLRQLAASLSDSGKGLYTAGLEEFDRLRIRLSPGQFIVVGGRPGMGKTYFLLFLYKQLWQMRGAAALQDAVQPARCIDLFHVARSGGVQGDEQRGDVLHEKHARPSGRGAGGETRQITMAVQEVKPGKCRRQGEG